MALPCPATLESTGVTGAETGGAVTCDIIGAVWVTETIVVAVLPGVNVGKLAVADGGGSLPNATAEIEHLSSSCKDHKAPLLLCILCTMYRLEPGIRLDKL